jgi:hypothetical protein
VTFRPVCISLLGRNLRIGSPLIRGVIGAGFLQACEELRKAGCRLVYLDGSFVTRKERPGDFDACWDVQNVDDARLDPVLWDFSRGREAQKQRFLGELFPAQLPGGATGKAFVDFFQINRMSGEPKGILESG